MNERIRELALKSGIAYLSEHTAYLTANDGLTVLPSVSSLEQFAELIINECLEWCSAYASIDGTAQQIRDAIKKDFGVEE